MMIDTTSRVPKPASQLAGAGRHWVIILRTIIILTASATGAVLSTANAATAALPDDRGYELISPVAKNGLSPYAATPSIEGGAVDFQARGAFAGATSGALSLYKATRTPVGWQTVALTPIPSKHLGSLEEQVPVWLAPDLSQTIFTTPATYSQGDQNGGGLDLYLQAGHGGLTWLSQGTQGGGEQGEATFDGATADASHVVFSTQTSLLSDATGLGTESSPAPEYVYERDVVHSQTSLLSLDVNGQSLGYAATTLAAPYNGELGTITVVSQDGLFPGETIRVGEGAEAETAQIDHLLVEQNGSIQVSVRNGTGLSAPHPAGTPVVHFAEGAILGGGGHLTSGPPPAGEYLPANSESGTTTHAIASDGSKIFLEAPNPAEGEPVGLYMRQNNTTTMKIAGAAQDGTQISGFFGTETETFGSAHFEGAAADGSLAFFTSDEGLAGAAKGTELYEFNTTNHAIGPAGAMSIKSISTGMGGDRTPSTALTFAANNAESITVASTAGFSAGETIAFGPFEVESGTPSAARDSDLTAVIASVTSPTELKLQQALAGLKLTGPPPGTEVHGVHPASMTAVSNDGSRVYFISDGVLAMNANSRGATAIPVKPNLYVFDTSTGETTFIATVAGSDVQTAAGSPTGLAGEPDISRPAIPTPDGGVLAFAAAGNLTGQNPWQEFTEIYRYTVAGNKLECLSCTAPGVKPTGNATFGETAGGTYDPPGLTSPMSEDGSRVFFDTPDSLVPEDTNGGAPQSAKFGTPTSTDVYEAEGGKVYLISSGKATTPTVLQGTTPTGDDVLFTTTAKLAPQDTDGGYENVWDARVGGGFPAEAGGGQPSCVGASCRAAFGVAPAFAAPASTTPQSAGSPPLSTRAVRLKPLTCRKGLVKKRVKGKVVCAKKSARKASHTAGKAGRAARARRAVANNVHRSR